ncbi:hypothetical protein D3C75_1038390 [compost metagenome]
MALTSACSGGLDDFAGHLAVDHMGQRPALVHQQMVHFHAISFLIENFAQQAVIRLQVNIQFIPAVHPDNPLLGEDDIVADSIHRAMRPEIVSSVIAHKGRQRADIEVPPGAHIREQYRVLAAGHNVRC